MWNNFAQTSNEDETISNIFCTSGIFKISGEELVLKYPQVQAVVQNKKMVITVDRSLILLEDENIAKCSFVGFNSQIDAIAVSNSGNVIVCGLADGEIHGIHIKGIPVFNLSIRDDDVQKKKSFIGIRQIDQKFYITCTNGSIYLLSDIDESRLDNCLNISIGENETIAFDEDALLENISITRLTTVKSMNEITAFTLIPRSNNDDKSFLFINGTKCFLRFQTSRDEDVKIIIPEQFQGLREIYNLENFVLGLTNSGHLLEICPITKIVNLNPAPAQDQMLIDNLIVMENNDDIIELLVLTKPEKQSDGEVRLMKFIEYPSFKCNYELQMPFNTWLVSQPKCSVNLYYLSGENVNSYGMPEEIEMKLVSETQPMERLKKLIAKGHLEEAEEFAKQFDLSMQPVYEAKAKRTIIAMSAYSDNDSGIIAEQFNTVIGILQLIENKKFFMNNRSIPMPSRRILGLYLDEVAKHLYEETDESHILEIKEQQLRLQTLNLIDPYECNMDWQKFVYHPNIEKECTALFKSDMLTACLIWKRHSASILPKLNQKDLCKLLTLIPNNTEAFNLVQWLRHFVPPIANMHPDIMPFITEWSIQKTRSLQFSDYWPEIGLEFSTKVVDIFEDIQFLHCDIRRQHERNIGKLRDLVNALQDLSVLKKSYNLTFTLDNYLQESIDETAFCILQRVHLINLKSLVNDFLYPIFRERGQSPVNAIRKYIRLLVANRHSLSTWLERAVASIELLHNEDERLESSLLVLKSAPVPWSDTLAPLIKLRYSTHPLATKIHTEYEIQFIKIMKVKYGWPADAADSNMKLVFRIIAVDLPEMADDIRTLTKSAPDIAASANFYCCFELARKGKIENAIKFFNSLEADQKAECAEKIINIISNILEDSKSSDSDTAQANIFEFFKLIIQLSPTTSNQKLLTEISNRQVLRHKFKLHLEQPEHLGKHEVRLRLLNEGVENLIERSRLLTSNIAEFYWHEISALTAALSLEKIFGVLRITQRMNSLALSCVLAYYTLEMIEPTQENSQMFIDLALVLIVQQITSSRSSKSSNAPITQLDLLPYPLAYKLLVQSMNLEQKYRLEVIEFLKWIRIVNNGYSLNAIAELYDDRMKDVNQQLASCLEPTNGDSNEINGSLDEEKCSHKRQSISVFDKIICPTQDATKRTTNSTDQMPIVRFVSHTILLVMLELKPENTLFVKLLAQTPNIIQTDLNGAREDFFQSLELLVKAKYHDTWYTVAQYLLQYQKNANCCIIHEDFVALQMRRVFRNMLGHKDPNFIDLFAMLINEKHPNVLLDDLTAEMKNYQQKINVLILSEMYNTHIDDLARVESSKWSRIKHFYYMEFCKQDANIKGKIDVDLISMNELMNKFRNKLLDVRLLERLSKDFDWDFQQTLISQVIAVLNAQEPSFEIKTDSFGNEELVMLSSVDKIKGLCQPYINEIKNTELFASKLLQFISEINLYFYELYLCVIEILSYIDAMPKPMQLWTNILHFLKHKMISKRRNRPGQTETDWWLQSQSEIGVLPKLAKYRLPFMPIVQEPLKEILDNELCVDNCESWFPLIQMHTLLKGTSETTEIQKMQDYFCMSAVKNSVTEYKARNDSDTWHLQPTNNAFLKSVIRLVQLVASSSKALMILYFVSNYAPDGADLVEASHECYKYAHEHEKEYDTQDKVQEILVKIKRKYPILKTQHLLHVYGLVEDKLMQLVENPTDLIYSLYHHEIILKSAKPDINTVVREIAELHRIDIDVLQFNLLEKWLSNSTGSDDTNNLEETFFEDANVSISNNIETNSAENVMRAYYILNSWDDEKAMTYLVGSIFPADGAVNTCKQLQMYECFSQLNDGSTHFSGVLNQRKYITIKCVHELKQLGYNFSLEKFADYNKIDILKKIWQQHAENSSTLEIIANICLGFDIYLPKIWNGILKRMAMFQMVRQLNALVDVLSCKPELLHIDGLAIAWECVLKAPFKKANRTKSFEQEETLIKTLFRLQSCPLVDKLNLYEIADDCVRLERAHMGAIMIAFSGNDEERQKIKTLIGKRKDEKLRKEIMQLEESGILSSILNYVLKELHL